MRTSASCLLLALLATGCQTLRLGPSSSPREQYAQMLERSGLANAALARDWTAAGTAALADPMLADSPFRESGYFAPAVAGATAYQLQLARGRKLVVDVEFDSSEPGRLFVDLFRHSGDRPIGRVASMPEGTLSLEYDVERDATYVLLIQPELLRGGRYTIVERTLATLRMPVEGVRAGALQSVFGDARDAGRRDHEGVDIFAPRGTPAIAVIDGTARMDTNGLGGNVIWLRGSSNGPTFYYAHLDRWAFEGTLRVRAGETIGFVGNTGNARTTAPHLHFGIYEGGAIDPAPFLRADDPVPAAPATRNPYLGRQARTRPARTPVRRGIGADAPVRVTLEAATPLAVIGQAQSLLRVVLPDGTTGYVAASALTDIDTSLRRDRLTAGTRLRERPTVAAPVVHLVESETSAEVLGRYRGFRLIYRTGSADRPARLAGVASPGWGALRIGAIRAEELRWWR